MTAPTTQQDSTPPVPPAEPSDLGFGRVLAQQVRGRFLSRDGVPISHKYGLGTQYSEKFYLRALNARWPAFLVWMAGGLLLLNGCFALAYNALGPAALHGSDV